MKKNAFTFIAILGIILSGAVPIGSYQALFGQAIIEPATPSFKYVSQLCYRERIQERIKTVENLNTLTLTLNEKLLFRNKEQMLYHTCVLDENKRPLRTTHYESSQNVYPDWYQPPSYTTENAEGIRSWFTTDNSYLPGGWVGATFKDTEHGSYQSDARMGGSRSFYMHHTSQSQQAFNRYTEFVTSFGFLYDLVFTAPDRNMLDLLASQGYEIYTSEDYISIQNQVIKVFWKLREKSMMQIINNENNEKIIVFSKYTFDEHIGEYVKEKETTKEPFTFENGSCAEKITEVTFSDYSSQCVPGVSFRIKNLSSKAQNFSLHPNPASDHITIKVADYKGVIQTRIYSNQGMLVQHNTEECDGQITLDTERLPAGSYTIRVQAGSMNWQSTFIKL